MKLVRRSVSNWAYMILALSMAVAGVANADVTPPVIYVDNLNFNVNDGDSALGSVTADETVTWSIAGAGVSINSAGSVTLDSPADYLVKTSHSFDITATDTPGNSRSIQVTVAVNDITSPVLDYSGLVTSIDDGGTALGSIAANEPVDWSISGSGVSINSSGVIALDSPADFLVAESHSFTVSATDKQGGAAVVGYLFIVEVNDITAPVLDYSGLVTSINDGGAALGSMAANEPVDWSISGSGVSISGSGVITLESPADFLVAESHSFTVSATDKQGGAAVVGYLFTVAVNDVTAPIIYVDNLDLNVNDGDSALGSVTADETVTWSIAGAGVSISSAGSVTLDSPADYLVKTSYSFDITATDTSGNFRRIPVTVVVNDITSPVLDYSGLVTSINDGGKALGSMAANEPVDWSISGSGVSINSSGVITLESPADFLVAESHSFTVSATDKQGGAGVVSYLVTIAVNDITAPIFDYSGLLTSVDEGSTALGSISANEPVTWSISGSGVSISSGGVVTLDSPASYEVASSHAYRVSAVDKQAGYGTDGYLFTVAVNDTTAPVITLQGSASITLNVGDVFTDPGATATDNKDGNLTADIVVTGTVDTSKVGTYTLSYNVSDAAGNAATPVTRSVKVVAAVAVDTVAPVITLLGAASIELEVGAVFTDPGATATDAVDGDLTADIVVTGTVDTSKVDTYTLSYNVSDAAGNAATSVARTVNVVDAAIPFTLVIPADLTVNAAGFLTAVDLDPEDVASAIYGDGIAIDVVADQLGPFQSGRYEIVWSATNAGLTVTDTQILKVVPMVNLGVDVTTTEGSNLSIDVLLSGQAADYPVSIPFTVSGTAAEGDDYTVGSTGSVIITEGKIASISLSIVADEAAESEENVVITLGEATNAVLGVNTDQVITIVEGNLPPKVTLQISQAGIAGSTIAQNLGVAMINVAIFDANATDTHTVDWAKTLLTLPNATVGVKALEFDAAALAVGVYLVEVDISDGVEIVSVAVNLNVLAQAPVLSADADSDGDGISDADEGYGDSDGDGIPDYLDNIAEPNLIPFGDSGAVVESEPGTQMILGGFALGAGGNNVGISEEYIAALTGIADNSFDYPGGLIDFILTGAEPGYSYTLVVPLSVAIPESAVYRKYSASGGWADFVFSGTNALSTAMSVEGACPALGSDLYTLGLTAGDDCLQMFIEDGGPNDADSVANGSLFDPGGIAVRDIGIPSSNSQVVLSNTTLKANGTDSTTVTVTALSAEGVGLEFMNVTGSMALVGVVVSDFVEQGSGIYTATVTAGMTSGNGPVTVVIDNGDTSITVSSERLQITAIEKSSSGGGGCTVASNGSSDASLLVLLVLAGLLLARRRYLVR